MSMTATSKTCQSRFWLVDIAVRHGLRCVIVVQDLAEVTPALIIDFSKSSSAALVSNKSYSIKPIRQPLASNCPLLPGIDGCEMDDVSCPIA